MLFSLPTTLPAVALHLIALSILLVITIIDAKTMTIPNGLNLALLICGIAAAFIVEGIPLADRFIGLLCVSAPLLLITILVPQSFGGGDVKLMAAAGFLLGWQLILLAACVGTCIGAVYGIYLLLSKKKSKSEHFAFGPALCTGIALAMFFGPSVLSWYQLL
jgi:leader peptidase (prepilin peptidase)/N-methyltransferase